MPTPAECGYRFPAEWTPHRRCWMAWPCNGETFADLEAPRRAYAEVARTISRFEPVTVVVDPRELGAAQSACGDGVSALPLEIDDSWTRDTGPTYLVDGRGEVGGVDWKFNGYGKFEPHDRDAAMSGWMLERSGARRFEAPIFLEGGAIHGDGRGTLLTTESVVLNPNRNPGLTRDAADAIFRSFLGVSQVVWLDAALEVDTTDGHVDNLACFTQPGVVAVLAESDTSDPHYEPLRENRRRLELSKDAEGRPFEIVEIQQPARREYRGGRLPFSYINYYIANGGIVLPVFGDPADERAIETVRKLHPDRQVVPVPALEIVKGGGGIHCITQQEPNPRSPS